VEVFVAISAVDNAQEAENTAAEWRRRRTPPQQLL